MKTIDVRGFFIGGEWTRAARASRLPVVDPATGTQIGSAPSGRANEARAAVHAARWAFDDGEWRRLGPAGRAAALSRLAAQLTLRRAAFIDLAVRESGATAQQAESRLTAPALDAAAWYAARAARDTETRLPDANQTSSLLVRHPRGVAGVIAASSEPLSCIVHRAMAALAAGNTVVLKAPSGAPLTAYLFAEACEAAELPAGVVNVVSGRGVEMGREIAGNAMVDVVAVAGTSATVRSIAKSAAPMLKPVIATAGAPGTALVLQPVAAQALVAAWLAHSGQAWGAACRIIVVRGVFDDVVDSMTHAAKGLRIGTDGDVGPLRTAAARARVLDMIDEAGGSGAIKTTGGGIPEHLPGGCFMEPCVLAGVDPGTRIAREEVAGPAAAIIPVPTREGAIALAQVQSSVVHVWAEGRDEALEIARAVNAGAVFAQGGGENLWAPQTVTGLGAVGGTAGIDAFTTGRHLASGG